MAALKFTICRGGSRTAPTGIGLRVAAALLFFVVASSVFTWPLVTHMDNTLPDWGDAADSAKNIGSIALQLRTDPLRLYDSPFVYPLKHSLTLGEIMTGQGILAAPVIWATGNIPLAYNLLNFSSYVLSGLAVWLLVRHLTGSSAAGLVGGMVFAFSPWHYSQYVHLGLGAQHWMVFALFFLILFMESSAHANTPRLLTRRSLLNLGLFAAFFVLQALTTGYYAYYEAVLVGIYLVYYGLFASRVAHVAWRKLRRAAPDGMPLDWKRLAQQLGMVALACLVALAIILPFALPYAQTKSEFGFKRDLEEVNFWSAGPLSLLQHSGRSWLYLPVEWGVFKVTTGIEGEMYPGVVAVSLALVGLFGGRATRRQKAEGRRQKAEGRRQPITAYRLLPPAFLTDKARFAGPGLFAAISLVGLVLSFGPSLNWDLYTRPMTGIRLPYGWLYDHVPGWDSMRVPHRFALLLMLGLAVCAGYGVARLGNRGEGRGVRGRGKTLIPNPSPLFPVLAMLLVGIDFIAPGLPAVHTPTGDATPPLYRWLTGPEGEKTIPKDALLLELPISDYEHPITSKPIYLMYALAGARSEPRPMLNASINVIPPGFERFHYDMQQFPTAATLDVIQALGARFIIVHTGELTDAKRADLERQAGTAGPLEPVASFPPYTGDHRFKDVVYRVKPDRRRIEKLAAAIPEGAAVMLSEDVFHKHLYTNALASLLGPKWRYFSQYQTIYDPILGNIQPATPNYFYDRAILYKEAVLYYHGNAGYAPSEAIPGAENDLVQVFKKVYQK